MYKLVKWVNENEQTERSMLRTQSQQQNRLVIALEGFVGHINLSKHLHLLPTDIKESPMLAIRMS
jgi:hypothetical protein